MTLRSFHIITVAILSQLVDTNVLRAQLDVPSSIEFNGITSSDRQLIGLSPPVDLSDAVSLDAARATTFAITTVTGTSELVGTLIPAPTVLYPGMMITILPTSPSSQGATLDLNGTGARSIVKSGGIPLATGDLFPGVPARLVYVEDQFLLLSGTQIQCPVGYSAVTRGYCIADQPQPSADFFSAISYCIDQDARLCTLSEWSAACQNLTSFFGTVTEAEWVDHAANNTTGAKLVGFGINSGDDVPGSGCEFGGQSPPTAMFRYRCCSDR